MSAEAQRRYRERHPDRIRASDEAYMSTEHGRATRRRAQAAWKQRNPESVRMQRAAGMRVIKAVRRGDLVKSPCVVCGLPEVQAHHPNGYEGDAALDVRWLCVVHHRKAHDR